MTDDIRQSSGSALGTSAEGAAKGVFITFEGGEGAGKSTQIAHLKRRLADHGLTVVETREPGGSAFADGLRTLLLDAHTAPQSALAQALAFYAARADHLAASIRPALKAGKAVLCDRFSDSTRAYQGAAGELPAELIEALDRAVVGETRPMLTLLLDIDPKVGLQRANARRTAIQAGGFIAADSFEGRQLQFHRRVREGFLAIARAEPERVFVIDAFQNELVIADAIWVIVAERLGFRGTVRGTDSGGAG